MQTTSNQSEYNKDKIKIASDIYKGLPPQKKPLSGQSPINSLTNSTQRKNRES